jgi:hypothetical protein
MPHSAALQERPTGGIRAYLPRYTLFAVLQERLDDGSRICRHLQVIAAAGASKLVMRTCLTEFFLRRERLTWTTCLQSVAMAFCGRSTLWKS